MERRRRWRLRFGGNGGDDDLNDVRRDDDDGDGNDFPLREGISLAGICLSEELFSLFGFCFRGGGEKIRENSPRFFRSG